MPQGDSFSALMVPLRARDPEAARALFGRFTQRLVALARRRLAGRLRRKEDPEDVVQSVYKSFFPAYADGRFDPASWEQLWGLLAAITVNKCRRRAEHWAKLCRDPARETSPGPGDEGRMFLEQVLDPEPTPEEAVRLQEAVERLLRGLDPEDRAILELSLQGYTSPEIAEQLSEAERTVRRVRERAHKRLLRMVAEEP